MQVNETTISQISLPSEPCSIQRKIQQAPSTMQSLQSQESCRSKIYSLLLRLWQFLTCTKKVQIQNTLDWKKVLVGFSHLIKDNLIKGLKNLKGSAFDTIGLVSYVELDVLVFFSPQEGHLSSSLNDEPETTRFTKSPGKALVLVFPKTKEAETALEYFTDTISSCHSAQKTLHPYFENQNKMVCLSLAEATSLYSHGIVPERIAKIIETGYIPPNPKYPHLSGRVVGFYENK